MRVEQMPLKNISTNPDEAVFEAYKIYDQRKN